MAVVARPTLGDVYEARDSGGTPYVVRVVGYTAKRVITESVPMLREDTGGFRCMGEGTHRIDVDWLQTHPLPARPLKKGGLGYVLMRIATAEDGTIELHVGSLHEHWLANVYKRVADVRAYVQHSWGHD